MRREHAAAAGLGLVLGAILACACGSSRAEVTPIEPAAPDAEVPDTSTPAPVPEASAEVGTDASTPYVDSLPSNRDRLIGSYAAYRTAPGVCDAWKALDPSAQAAFLTLTARLQGSKVGDDGTSMLSHVTKLYRIAGGEGATAADPGSCGGGEYNRLIMSMDAHLHASLLAASANKGQAGTSGKPDIIDVANGTVWRDSRDLGGAHAPFDKSDETEVGAPRGQVQFFADPNSMLAKSPLGRMDLTALVDPYALEMDHDYDCTHNSNPLCSYTTYGALCVPGPSQKGTELYTTRYGSFDPSWQPAVCAE